VTSKWSFTLRVSNQNFVRISHLPHARYMPRPSHPPLFDNPNNIWWRVNIMELLIMQCSQSCCHSLLGPNILLSTLFSNTLNLCSPVNLRGQIAYPYKTRGEIILFYILIFTCLDGRWEYIWKDSLVCSAQ
jgi:hypothetical protein